jgi:bifunctional enzyme CysN/CysC
MAAANDSLVRVVACGSVDDGKSTLIGRLLWDSRCVMEDHALALARASVEHGTREGLTDFALLLDGLLAEREQGITIDAAYRGFETPRRRFILADAPGHLQYTRNMATAASSARLAILLVDARKGLLEQTFRHARILALMGVRRVVVAVNKMDLAGWQEPVFASIATAFGTFAADNGFLEAHCVPVCAPDGDNIVHRSARAPWHAGPTLVEWLETVALDDPSASAFRMPVQWVNRPGEHFRGWSGRIAAGSVRPGDEVVALPGGAHARVASISTFDGDLPVAVAGQSVTLVFSEPLDAGRGDVIAAAAAPPPVAAALEADLLWLGREPLLPGRAVEVRIHACSAGAIVSAIHCRTDLGTGAACEAGRLATNEAGVVELALDRPVAFEPYGDSRPLGGLILVDRATGDTVAAGMVRVALRRAAHVRWQPYAVDRAARERAMGQRARCIWFTGLPGSGKSTIANLLEQALLASGRHTFVLDGDNVRHGLSRDLAFSDADRAENVRRVSEVARLMVDAGLIVLVSFISPFLADRAAARARFEPGDFLEVFVDAPLDECMLRDPKGLYARARRGEITDLTGFGSPYEAPAAPDLHLRTAEETPEASALRVLHAIGSGQRDA